MVGKVGKSAWDMHNYIVPILYLFILFIILNLLTLKMKYLHISSF